MALEESHAPATKCVRPVPQLHVPCVSVNRLVTVHPPAAVTVSPGAALLISTSKNPYPFTVPAPAVSKITLLPLAVKVPTLMLRPTRSTSCAPPTSAASVPPAPSTSRTTVRFLLLVDRAPPATVRSLPTVTSVVSVPPLPTARL